MIRCSSRLLHDLGLSDEGDARPDRFEIDAFPEAEFVVQQAQYRHATESGLLRYEWLRAHWDVPALRWRLIDGDTELLGTPSSTAHTSTTDTVCRR